MERLIAEMGLQNFNIVLIGSNIPVSTINLDDLTFQDRPLQATLRMPVALQAEARGVALTIFPERFQVAVTEPHDIANDAGNLVQMTEVFFGYVGPRSLTATGHNALFTIDGTAERKDDVRRALVEMDHARELIGHDLLGADATVFFRLDQQSVTRMIFSTMVDGDVQVDVNINYDRTDLGAAEAVARLPHNLEAIAAIADNLGTRLAGRVTS
jgi:hypothetical protein